MTSVAEAAPAAVPRSDAAKVVLVGLLQGALLAVLNEAVWGAWRWIDSPFAFHALQSLAILLPLTAQLLVRHWARGWFVVVMAGAAAALLLLAIEAGTRTVAGSIGLLQPTRWSEGLLGFSASIALVWFIAISFVQAWANRGMAAFYVRWFDALTGTALLLFEAAVVLGLVHLVLLLWAQLFKLIGIDFFHELFDEGWFAWLASMTAFGLGLALGQSMPAFLVTARRLICLALTALWPLVAVAAILFVAALPFTGLELLWDTGRSSVVLLSLVALLVLMQNGAFRDGESPARLPLPLRFVTTVATILLPAIVGLAAYSFWLRVGQHGYSAGRVGAAAVIIVAGLYAVAYAGLAMRFFLRLQGLDRVNPALAGAAAVVALLLNTPLASPERIAARDQANRLIAGEDYPATFDWHYLRYSLGTHGMAALERLATVDGEDERAMQIRAAAQSALSPEPLFDYQGGLRAGDLRELMRTIPAGREIAPGFVEALTDDESSPYGYHLCDEGCAVLMVDLLGDAEAEYVVATHNFPVYQRQGDRWVLIGSLDDLGYWPADLEREFLDTLERGAFTTAPAEGRDLIIDGRRFPLNLDPPRE